ncbi:MAG: NnrS family protein [Polyangiaceae bacterium]
MMITASALRRPGLRTVHRSSFAAFTQKGFRLFFLLAALYASCLVPVWLLVLAGKLRLASSLDPTLWHAHEMLFGYAAAVIAGFLLTAASRWSSRETAVGGWLTALVVLWLGGRIALFLPLPAAFGAAIDLLFMPALAVAVGQAIVLAKNRRNYAIVAMILLLAVANTLLQLGALGVLPGWDRRGLYFGLDVVVLMMVVIGGRVIPMFTRNATGDARVHSSARVDVCAALLCLAAALARLAGAANGIVALLSGAAAIALVVRSRSWGAWVSRREPLLWILHAGNAFIALGLGLRASSFWFPSLVSSATHALTAGAIGCLTLGMMSRVSLGHTGRLIVASRATRVAFCSMVLAALLRVAAPLAPAVYLKSLSVAGALWALSLLLFVVEYWPVLSRPRADGTPG